MPFSLNFFSRLTIPPQAGKNHAGGIDEGQKKNRVTNIILIPKV